jgi:hypothetical protein
MAGCYGFDVEVELRQMLVGGLDGKSKKLVDPTGVEEGVHWAGLLESRPSLQVNTFLYIGQRNLLHFARTLSLEFEEGLCLHNC